MSTLRDLQSARSRRDLATLLGYQLKTLTYLVFRLPDPLKYVDFQIPKRSGGMRSISAPEQRLKVLQQRLAGLLYACLDELESSPRRRTLSHGFVHERSILTTRVRIEVAVTS